jgi:hypothetical protein
VRTRPSLPAASVLLAFLAAAGDAWCGTGPNSIGAVIGSPQFVGLCYERAIGGGLSLGAHLGTLVVLNSAGARLILGPTTPGFHPRLAAGIALINSQKVEYEEDPEGTAAYFWPSAGFSQEWPGGFMLTCEIGALLTGNEDAGLGSRRSLSFSLGLLRKF